MKNFKYTLYNWDQVIGYIKNWQDGCVGFEGEEYEAPTIKSIDRAIAFAEKCLIWKINIPDRITPTGDGGIIFEWGEQKDAKVYEIDEDGNLETYKFEGNKLADRRQLDHKKWREQCKYLSKWSWQKCLESENRRLKQYKIDTWLLFGIVLGLTIIYLYICNN